MWTKKRLGVLQEHNAVSLEMDKIRLTLSKIDEEPEDLWKIKKIKYDQFCWSIVLCCIVICMFIRHCYLNAAGLNWIVDSWHTTG